MARGDTLHRTLKVIRLLELNPRGLSVKQIEDRLKADEHIREVCSMGNEVIAIGRHENDVSSTKDELVK
ncbi:MAG: hypothetical protein IPJ84_15245 [Bdellovibrionales bacterium]|nr:hypothetical protein [Bdellovibrionales bacterium]